MRLAAGVIAIALASACARPLPPAAVAPPPPTPTQRLASADELVRAGCLDCLIAAYGEYDLLRTFPAARDAAISGAVRSAALIALRERELGLVDDGYGERARALLIGAPNLPNFLSTLLDIIAVLPASVGGIIRTPTSDLDLDRARVLRANRSAWETRLRELAPIDELAAYVWLAFSCGSTEGRDVTLDQLVEPVATFKDSALIGFKRGICRGIEAEPLQALRTRDPRFGEVPYYLGLLAVSQRKLDDADRRFEEAYAWRTQWPSLTQSIANVAMTAEEFERSLSFYNKTLELEPHAVDAMLGRVRALTYLGRNQEAIETTDLLIADRWFVGDARYWRALNESELDLNEEAWVDVEAAGQRAGAEARRPDRVSPAAVGCLAGEVRGIADAQPDRLRNLVLPRRRAGGAARMGADRRGPQRGGHLPRGQRQGVSGRDRLDSGVERSAGAQGEQGGEAGAIHRQGAAADRHLVVRYRGGVLQPGAPQRSAAVRREGCRRRAVRRARARPDVAPRPHPVIVSPNLPG
jgi:tetratricopeptide (TPR) repeat protein